MEELEISEVNLREVLKIETHRFDSDYYKKKYIQLIEQIDKQKVRFKNFGDFDLKVDASAFYPSLEPYYNTGDFPFLRVADVNTNINYESCVRVPLDVISNENFKTLKIISEGDIIITKGGSIARVGLIQQRTAVTRDLIFINSSILSEIDYKFLFLYLLSSLSYNLLIRSSSMTAQPHLTIKLVRDLPLFTASDGFKGRVASVYDTSQIKLRLSQSLYQEAEGLLLKELGLDSFKISNDAVNVKSFSESFTVSGRLDAEYYQKKYDDLESVLKLHKVIKIKSIKNDNFRGLQPKYIKEGDLDVINSRHILERTLDYEGFEKTDKKYWDLQKRARVFKGDILTYTTGANIGRTQVYKSDKKALASNHVNILRINSYNPIYIGFVMNSIVGRMQTEKLSAGSAQAELYPKDIDEFLIPVIDVDIQNEIIGLIEESFKFKNESEYLLEIAKKAVEVAIEQNETKALKYMVDNTSLV